jgi:hypothetical protein
MLRSYFFLALAGAAFAPVRAEEGFGDWGDMYADDDGSAGAEAGEPVLAIAAGVPSNDDALREYVPKVAVLSGRCEPEYLGCFPDLKSDRAMPYFAGLVHSPSQCALLCAHHAAHLGTVEGSVPWAGVFALQVPRTNHGVACSCGYGDSDHTKHVREGATCLVKGADGMCASWYDGTPDARRHTECATCPYPHDLEQCGGPDANSVYRVAHCGDGDTPSSFQQTLSELQKRHDARKSHVVECTAPGGARGRPRTQVLRKRGCVAKVHAPNEQAWAYGAESGVYIGDVDTPWECAYACERKRTSAFARYTHTSFGLEGGRACYCINPTMVSFLPSGAEQAAALRGAPDAAPAPSADYILCDTMMCKFGDEFCGGRNHLSAYDIVHCDV